MNDAEIRRSVAAIAQDAVPHVIAALMRRTADFASAEDAVQEALLDALEGWPKSGLPENPAGWLYTTALRRWADRLDGDSARRRREGRSARAEAVAPIADCEAIPDDTLRFFFACAHPALSEASRAALTLRVVGGLSTGAIAAAFFADEKAMGQRIARAKETLRGAGGIDLPLGPSDRRERVTDVLRVIYLIYSEGHTRSAGETLGRPDLAVESIRLARLLHRLMPEDGEVAALLVLLILTEARRGARTGPADELIPLDEQDRRLWAKDAIREGIALLDRTFARTPIGPYQLQAAIAALHAEAKDVETTDWRQILYLYECLEKMTGNPMVGLQKVVAIAMIGGPAEGLSAWARVAADPRIAGHFRTVAVRAHLLERLGDPDAARAAYAEAAEKTENRVEREYLLRRAARL